MPRMIAPDSCGPAYTREVESTDGIGSFILDAQRKFRVAQMYAGMLALEILGYIFNQLFNLVHRSLPAWHEGMTKQTE
jgi:ABC-type nitrate/sulfonate/bicarbonate transport system permease component